ncbi:MAG: hypothetical protein ACOCSP_02245, partial [archaeon]
IGTELLREFVLDGAEATERGIAIAAEDEKRRPLTPEIRQFAPCEPPDLALLRWFEFDEPDLDAVDSKL